MSKEPILSIEKKSEEKDVRGNKIGNRKYKSDFQRTKLSKLAKDRLSDPKNNPMYGKKHKEQSKKKMSESRKGISPWHKGKVGVYSEETKLKQRMSKLGTRRRFLDINEIIKLNKEGKTIRNISAILNTTGLTIRKTLSENNVKLPRVITKPNKKIDLKKVMQLRKEGKSWDKIAVLLNSSRGTIRRRLALEKTPYPKVKR